MNLEQQVESMRRHRAVRHVVIAAIIAVLAYIVSATAAVARDQPIGDWSDPGRNPYTGTVEAALARYEGRIVPRDLAAIRAKIAARQWDDHVTIRRDSIAGRSRYLPDLRAMHWGAGHLTETVDRSAWAPGHTERALVYCGAGPDCVAIPSVCRNVAIVTRAERPAPAPGPVPAAAQESAGGEGLRGTSFPPLPPLPPLPPPVEFTPLPPAPAIQRPPAAAPMVMPSFAALSVPMVSVAVPIPAPVVAVNEPSTLALLGAGLLLIARRSARGR